VGLAHFQRNVGIWGIVRGVFVSGLMLALGVLELMREGRAAPLAAFLVGLTVPMLLRRRLVAHLETSGVVLKYAGYGLLAMAASSPAWLDRVSDGVGGEIFAAALLGVVGLYLSAWFAVCSDRTVITALAQRRRAKSDDDVGR
jgi:hypothetical protein